MKLYANPNHRLAKQPFYSTDTIPASAYRIQQQILAAYREMSSWYDTYDLLEQVYLPGSGGCEFCDETTGRPLRGAMSKLPYHDWARKQVRLAKEKLQEMIPEVIMQLTPEELDSAADILLSRGLVPFIWHIFAIERGVQYRIEEGNCYTRLSDESHAKAVGLGRVYRKKPAIPHPIEPDEPPFALPIPKYLPVQETSVIPVTPVVQVTSIAEVTPAEAPMVSWPQGNCAVCPRPKLRQKPLHKSASRKRLHFHYRH